MHVYLNTYSLLSFVQAFAGNDQQSQGSKNVKIGLDEHISKGFGFLAVSTAKALDSNYPQRPGKSKT